MFTTNEGGFGVGDYVAFVVLCVASSAGGVWYSATASKKEAVVDIEDYLLGRKTMKTFPVAMSLIASYVSGVTLLGTPSEIYNYGSQYFLVVVGIILSCVIVVVVYLPLFSTLRLSSSYEYLELRFNRQVRAAASILFMFDEILFLPIVVYLPALAFNQLTGLSVILVGAITVLICGAYTALGGLRAVVWTDAAQTALMYVGVVVVAIAGTIDVGGFSAVMDLASKSNRARLDNWDLSPYERQTGWGAIIGAGLYWTCFNSVNQTMVQRYIALPSKMKAIWALAIFCVGAVLTIMLVVWCGLTAFASWVQGGCYKDGVPPATDRILPAYVCYIAEKQNLPGLTGVFLAGLFGAALSSLSVVLNACALVVVEDIMHGWLRIHLKPMAEGILVRSVTAILAVLSIAMLLVVQHLGGILGVATALSAIAASVTCGIFTLGMLCCWVGTRGALAGSFAGSAMTGFLAFGQQYAAAQGLRAPFSDYSAACSANTTSPPMSSVDPTTIFPLFRISYHWVAPLGLLTTLVVGMVVGYFLDARSNWKMDAELYSPVVWRWLPQAAHEHAGITRRQLRERLQPKPVTAPSSPPPPSSQGGVVNKTSTPESQ